LFNWHKILRHGHGRWLPTGTAEPPLRDELLGADQMKQHGRTLAALHQVGTRWKPERLLSRLSENEAILVDVTQSLARNAAAKRTVMPAGEWLLDNFYLVEEQIRMARRHLPRGYSRELPRLTRGPSAGLPRVYDIAQEAISHGDGRLDPDSLAPFVEAYQTLQPLKLGELWAIPIMLRLALIENLRRVAVRIASGNDERERAAQWAADMREAADHDPKNLILVTADMARSNPSMSSAFVAEFVNRLQGRNSSLSLPLTWIEQRLTESNQSIDQLVQTEIQQQAADQVSIGNSIGSLRTLGTTDWRAFVENLSLVERHLRQDPAAVYLQMDFATRDRYRRAVEKRARKTGGPEDEVAREAVEKARIAACTPEDDRARHVGFHLIRTGPRPFSLPLYLGCASLLTLLFTAGLLLLAPAPGLPRPLLFLPALLGGLCLSQVAVALVNFLVSLLVRPNLLPRLDYSEGIPSESRTLIVIPSLLSSVESVNALVESLEVRFLANRDKNIHAALLTDLPDARAELLPGEQERIDLAAAKIAALNAKYGPSRSGSFFLFHRPRLYNEREGVWMGYERKRGKLAALNALLRDDPRARGAFSLTTGPLSALQDVRYVITLDTDTLLPRDAARTMIGAMAHPLNRPRFDPATDRPKAGYAILQPRVNEAPGPHDQTRYALLFGQEPGIDPYTRASADVYQDLFAEGSFTGKGIYDIDAFERSLGHCLPANRILSHDLIEGCYARSGFLSDVQLPEACPAHYACDASRRHRWVRGDWQIGGWLFPRVPGPAPAGCRPNPLSFLSQWKILDNLRRSLVAPASLLLLALAWLRLPAPFLWTLAALAPFLAPPLFAFLPALLGRQEDVPFHRHVAAAGAAALRRAGQVLFTLACLPHEALSNLDAIVRVLYRLLISRRRLLEWSPSAVQNGHRPGLAGWLRLLAPAPLAAAAAIALVLLRPPLLPLAAPFIVLWASAPFLAWLLGQPIRRPPVRLTPAQRLFLRETARKTWSFFETFVVPEEHHLPPDNIQQHPFLTVAHRTSPTNMGLALLANLAACDFGYITAGRLIDRTAAAFETMASMKRYKGHFFNWYDTRTLAPLPPLYVSSVDSGNLAGHLMTLRQGLAEIAGRPVVVPAFFGGLADTLRLLAAANPDEREIAAAAELLAPAAAAPPASLQTAWLTLDQLARFAESLVSRLEAGPGTDALHWARALADQCHDGLRELADAAPWTALPGAVESLGRLPGFDRIPSLREMAESAFPDEGPAGTDAARLPGNLDPRLLENARRLLRQASARARRRLETLEALDRQAFDFAQIDYGFLFDPGRKLLAIGYNADERRRDTGFYDLLASEARLAAFVGIAQGRLPQESWFALGRLLASSTGEPVLLSWSGSMFEYLMPLLVMPSYPNSLLEQSCRAAVNRQIAYGRSRGRPWGVSESGYNAVDVQLTYQYRAFGVPGLGLQRGLADDYVVSPYATALALLVAPERATANLQRLSAEGFEGRFGFFEAIDYSPARLNRGKSHVIIRSFMAHHQSMSLLALGHLLHDRPMQRRFESEPAFRATAPLLQERIPLTAVPFLHTAELAPPPPVPGAEESGMRIYTSPHTPSPEAHLLSNGRYHVMVTAAGGGSSRWKNLALTRWREDPVCDSWGTFCYVRDTATGRFWSTAHQPTLRRADAYEAIFLESRAEFRCRLHDILAHTEIAVSPEDDIELRRVTLSNRSRAPRTLDLTSYAEIVLAPPASDALHPGFGNLFVQTEILPDRQAILCTRRPRGSDEETPWMFHLMVVHAAPSEETSYETDRARFIGRGRSAADPLALAEPGPLSGSQGAVLDPIAAIRHRLRLEPDGGATINIVTGAAATREACLALIGKYRDRLLADRVFDLAWTHGLVALRQINAREADAALYGRLAGPILYADAVRRASPELLKKNRRNQSGLWGYSISGDLPIVLLKVHGPDGLDLVRQIVQAHAYWRQRGLAVDLVIWNEERAGYRQGLHDRIMGLIAAGGEPPQADRSGGIFVRPADQIPDEDRLLLQTVARVILSDRHGTLAAQLDYRPAPDRLPPARPAGKPRRTPSEPLLPGPRPDLAFFNGLGGFTADGREYIVTTAPGSLPPVPWVNVIANPGFGTLVSESGYGYTWSENAHEYRLTPWSNDPVADPPGQALFLRDEESGNAWSATPLPLRPPGAGPAVTRHGFGYSVFEFAEDGVASELWVYVDIAEPVQYSVLRVRNRSDRARRLSATCYVDWVLGDLRARTGPFVVTELEPGTGALVARNTYNTAFGGRTAFLDTDEFPRTVTGDRSEFIGRNGSLRNPAALGRTALSGKTGAGLDPCGALQVPFDLGPGEERELVFRLGATADPAGPAGLIRRLRGHERARQALEAVWAHWGRVLGAVQVKTPDPAVDVLANGWLLYQTLACRLWARSGFYQSGGAFGFRDQLQDAMALVHAEPDLLRAQLLLAASRQFREGDVQHWWHPPEGRGVRTRCSDDMLWLPFAAARYVATTGDAAILDEPVPYLEGRELASDEESYYDLPRHSAETGTLYDHCLRAIAKGSSFGPHGLPLIGSGDWNDGLNRVGIRGRGESVWLAFFLRAVLSRFSEISDGRGDPAAAERLRAAAARLAEAVETHAWDGAWYRRAWFDDGAPLGSAAAAECRIDSVAQSWAVLSGAVSPERARTAMDSVDRLLVRRDAGLIQLLDPPFDTTPEDPGYIKGYVPGVRENGGQYTHAALWTIMAFAELGDAARAWELLALINPVRHGDTAAGIAVYKVEPFVAAADVYARPPHTGRGGWTWYTGSAGWFYRLILESLLGLRREGDALRLNPRLPPDWSSCEIHYRFRETLYHLRLRQDPAATPGVTLDGVPLPGGLIPLVDDRRDHQAEIVFHAGLRDTPHGPPAPAE
jgi:cellobiose phosphorylase